MPGLTSIQFTICGMCDVALARHTVGIHQQTGAPIKGLALYFIVSLVSRPDLLPADSPPWGFYPGMVLAPNTAPFALSYCAAMHGVDRHSRLYTEPVSVRTYWNGTHARGGEFRPFWPADQVAAFSHRYFEYRGFDIGFIAESGDVMSKMQPKFSPPPGTIHDSNGNPVVVRAHYDGNNTGRILDGIWDTTLPQDGQVNVPLPTKNPNLWGISVASGPFVLDTSSVGGAANLGTKASVYGIDPVSALANNGYVLKKSESGLPYYIRDVTQLYMPYGKIPVGKDAPWLTFPNPIYYVPVHGHLPWNISHDLLKHWDHDAPPGVYWGLPWPHVNSQPMFAAQAGPTSKKTPSDMALVYNRKDVGGLFNVERELLSVVRVGTVAPQFIINTSTVPGKISDYPCDGNPIPCRYVYYAPTEVRVAFGHF